MIKKLHYNIKVTGKVQGVWFRDSTLKRATQSAINGFVKNEPDGSVYIEAEGFENDLKKLVEWCHTGPPKARVLKVEHLESEMKNFSGFEIKE